MRLSSVWAIVLITLIGSTMFVFQSNLVWKINGYLRRCYWKLFVSRPQDCPERGCFSNRMMIAEEEQLNRITFITASILETHGIPLVPLAGTLAAVYRYNKLRIPWDDDADYTVQAEHKDRAVDILRNELGAHGLQIKFHYNRLPSRGGICYKIFNASGEVVHYAIEGNFIRYTWPYLDLYINKPNPTLTRKSSSLFPGVITKNELPLKQIKVPLMLFANPLLIKNVTLSVPTNGIRSLEVFVASGFMQRCVEEPWSHKVEQKCPCRGSRVIRCRAISTLFFEDA